MFPRNHRQEALSRAYVRAIAAQAGVICSDLREDYGIDICLRGVQETSIGYVDSGPQIDVQLKSTSNAEVTEEEIVYDLELRSYILLRLEEVSPPRILVLLLLPGDEREWLTQTVEELILRRCAFWTSLRGEEATSNERTVRIRIPRNNIFSVDGLTGLLDKVRQGNRP